MCSGLSGKRKGLVEIELELKVGGETWSELALIDTGAEINAINVDLVKKRRIPCRKPRVPIRLHAADGRQLGNGELRETEPIRFTSKGPDGYEGTCAFVPLGGLSHGLLLGMPWLERFLPEIDWKRGRLKPLTRKLDIEDISATGSNLRNYTNRLTINEMIKQEEQLEFEELKKIVPEKYQDFLEVFMERETAGLPPHRIHDCAIKLEEGATIPYGPIYSLSEPELVELRKTLDDLLAKGYIVPSKSPAASPILFVGKKDGGFRMCVDYRKLNAMTEKDRYPLPLITEALTRLRRAKIFSKIDLKAAYNLIRIKEGDEWKTAFRCRYGHFEYNVMPFGLTNAPAVFQRFINEILKPYLDITVIVYLDDILIFSERIEDHTEDVRNVLRELAKHQMVANIKKCGWDLESVEFLGHIISSKGVSMAADKYETILKWKVPTTVKEV